MKFIKIYRRVPVIPVVEELLLFTEDDLLFERYTSISLESIIGSIANEKDVNHWIRESVW